MRKDNIMFGVFGLIAGLVVGFVFANSLNKTAIEKPSVGSATSTSGLSGNPALPADHPPLGTSAGDSTQTAPVEQVMVSFVKA